ncbi:hypothetical protein OAQ80_04960 [Flavobacteriaceae bacterium]|nr:hypothetical protein [Flavobacteriaceae bacterium]
MISAEKQIETINNVINSTKENLKPLSINLIFWGIFVNVLSCFHFAFPSLVESSKYSAALYWLIPSIIGMFYMVYFNMKIRKTIGYETHLSRVIKIIWGVFGISWIYIVGLSFFLKNYHPVPPILFLLSLILIMTGFIIKFKPVTLGGIFLTIFTFYLNFNPGINLLLVNIVGVSLGMLVPGLSLFYYKSRNNPDG